MSLNDMIGTPLSVALAEECALIDQLVAELPTEGTFIGTSGDDIDFSISGGEATIDLLGGNDSGTVVQDTRSVTSNSGNNTIRLNNDAESVRLGGGEDDLTVDGTVASVETRKGNDTIDIGGSVKFLDSGAGDDIVTVGGNAHEVNLGDGNDQLTVEGIAGVVRAGKGNDDVTLNGGAVEVRLGAGNDTLTVSNVLAEFAAGGGGTDTLVFDFNSSDFDVDISGKQVIFSDRFTGETMVTEKFEEFEFNDRSFSLEEIREDFGDEIPYIQVGGGTQVVTVNDNDPGVSVIWDRVVQQAVIDTESPTGPTVASRAYAMMHTAMFDAWATFDETAVRVSSFDNEGDLQPASLAGIEGLMGSDEAKTKAMSFAALTVLRNLFPDVEELYVEVMEERFGFDLDDESLEAQVGIEAAQDLLALRGDDGSNQAGGYAGDFTPTNPSPLEINDITKWTPENVPIDPEDNSPEQSFLTPQWLEVESFALTENELGETDFDNTLPPPPQPFFTDAFLEANPLASINFETKEIELNDGSETTIAISKDLIGDVINQGFITQAEEVIEISAGLTDEQKIIAEFWEDGGGTAFPPGTWMTFGQFVSSRDENSLDQDAQLFFALGNAVFDAGIATWQAKVEYDYARPVRAIRDLGELGLVGEEGTDEITGETGFVIEAFGGFDEDGFGVGTKTILAENFNTFQRPGADPSPPFAEYTSGHSAFSAAGAEVLALFTGSDDFGGEVEFAPGTIQFEQGVPGETVVLEWETFSIGADEGGISRLFGGIHFNEGDINGRELGRTVGADAFDLAQKFINGTAEDEDRPFFQDNFIDVI